MSILSLLLLSAAMVAAVAAATHALIPALRSWQLMDMPNHRSSHDAPTPRGGGLAPVALLLVVGALLAWQAPAPGLGVLIVAALGLALLSLADDRRSLSAAVRLGGHALAAALGVVLAVTQWPALFEGLVPGWLLFPALILGWIWFINLFNFMDGIDGITGVELVALGAGCAIVLLVHGTAADPNQEAGAIGRSIIVGGALLAACGAGFLTANWHPAKVFMGDVGSVPLGFLAGGLLIALATLGHVAPALILPAYYVTDATVTLAKRVIKRENLAEAHRSHAYQRATVKGLSHSAVCVRLALLNAVLLALALLAARWPVPATLAAYGLSGFVYSYLLHYERWRRP